MRDTNKKPAPDLDKPRKPLSMEKPAPPGVLEEASNADASPSSKQLGDVPGTDWQRWLDKKQVKYFNKRTFVTTVLTPREVRDAEAIARAGQGRPRRRDQ